MIFGVRVIEKIEQGIYVFLEPLQCIQNKCDIESRIEFTVTKLVSLDTPYGNITKFLKNVRKMREKKGGKLFFLHFDV